MPASLADAAPAIGAIMGTNAMSKTLDTAADLAAAYDAESKKAPVRIDWNRPTACMLDQTPARNNTQYFQASSISEAMRLATIEADKIVASTGRFVGVFALAAVRIPIETPAQSMALAWQNVEDES